MNDEVTPDTFRQVAAHLLRAAAGWERAIARRAAPTRARKPKLKLPSNVIKLDVRRVSVIQVRPCPTCRAPVGRACRAGSRKVQPHRARKHA